jgi:hypothetical protein
MTTTIAYENPEDNPNGEAKLQEYLKFLSTSEDLINSQSSYEAFFFIGRFCLYATEWNIFLGENAPQIFIKTLKSLYEKREELKFDSANIEVGERPKSDEKDFKESIFSYTLFSFNILCKDLVRCEIFLHFDTYSIVLLIFFLGLIWEVSICDNLLLFCPDDILTIYLII